MRAHHRGRFACPSGLPATPDPLVDSCPGKRLLDLGDHAQAEVAREALVSGGVGGRTHRFVIVGPGLCRQEGASKESARWEHLTVAEDRKRSRQRPERAFAPHSIYARSVEKEIAGGSLETPGAQLKRPQDRDIVPITY